MMLSIYFDGAAGPLGELIGRLTGGLFGLLGYIIPLITFIYGIMTIFKPRTVSRSRKTTLILILTSLISALLQAGLHEVTFYQNMNVGQYITTFYHEGVRAIGKGVDGFVASGGVIGGIIGVPLLFVFKKLGTMIILITLAIISAMLLTRLSLADAAKSVARGTAEAVNGVVDAVRKKRSDRAVERSLREITSETAASETRPSTQRRARILDFPLQEVRGEETPEPPEAEFIQQEDMPLVLGDDLAMGQIPVETPAEMPVEDRKTVSPQKTVQQEDKPLVDETASEACREHKGQYVFPPLELLSRSRESEKNMRRLKSSAVDNAKKLEYTLESFGIGAKVVNVSIGPAFTRYELQPAPGVKVSRIVNLTDDIALNLAASGVRIEAPIPGKAAIGVEVPNKEVAPISLRSVLESRSSPSMNPGWQ